MKLKKTTLFHLQKRCHDDFTSTENGLLGSIEGYCWKFCKF